MEDTNPIAVYGARPKRLWLIGLTVWLIFVLIDSPRQPAATYTWKSLLSSAIEWGMWACLAPLIIWLDARLPVRRDDIYKRLLLHGVLCVCLTLCTAFLHVTLVTALLHPPQGVRLRSFFAAHVQIYWAIAGLYISYDYYKRFIERQIRATELEKSLAEARLETLRAQLQPHFLFNTLNAVSAQIELDPRAARRMIEQLGDLLRLSLAHSDAQEISLDQEMAFLDRYITLQKIRFDERLEVVEDIDPDALEAMVPAFILQPLVENAIRYGIETRAVRGTIKISAARNNGNVTLRVKDNGPGTPAAENRTNHGFGIGISNTRERLRHLYGEGEQSLNINSVEGVGTEVVINIPFRPIGASSENGTGN